MSTSWKNLEDHVRALASLQWKNPCNPEHIDGVDFDGVVRVSSDEIILIEITKERTLEKIRNDINKLAPVRLNLLTRGIICRCYIVLSEEPTNSMTELGEKSHIKVCSISDFEKNFFDFPAYCSLRNNLPFGSAVDSKTGGNDQREFISVRYEESEGSNKFTIENIVTKLLRGGKVALVGDFGAGKSRCVKEVHTHLCSRFLEAGAFPLAINLRDHWSSSNALEIIAGHLGNIGLSSSIDNVVQLLNAGNLILLLDGFDEIGAQSHDTRVENRSALRRRAVQGVRDLISKSKAGVLVTGRSHFFDSDEEMLQSLGLAERAYDLSLLSVPDSFTTNEGEQYLASLGIAAKVPEWLPRKPLVFQILAELDADEVRRMLSKEHGEYQFWSTFIDAACRRESIGVGESISSTTIKKILLELGVKTRCSDSFLGRLSPRDIDDAYEKAVGSAPDQAGRQLLSRMCTLGRIEPESPDRQFIEYNVVDILRSERLISDIISMSPSDTSTQWKQSIRWLGAIYASSMIYYFDLQPLCLAYLQKFGDSRNTYKIGEIVSTLTLCGADTIDFQLLRVSDSSLPVLNLKNKDLSNIEIKDSEIGILVIEDLKIKPSSGLTINGCIIGRACGVSSTEGLPEWITDTEILDFDKVSNSTRIKDSQLAAPFKLFLSIVHKIFFQAGSGREEASLLKAGFGQKYDPKIGQAILKILLKENIIEKIPGRDGWIYKPIRKHSPRMNKIRSELTLSDDPLWTEIGKLV